MTFSPQVELRCDGLPDDPFGCKAASVYARTVEQARREAEAAGWVYRDGKDLCAGHKPWGGSQSPYDGCRRPGVPGAGHVDTAGPELTPWPRP